MKFIPFHDWAVVRRAAAEEITAGGLYIPETAKQKPHEGVVEAIGPGAYEEIRKHRQKTEKSERRFVPTTVKAGNTVLYEQYSGGVYKIDGEERVLVRERDILGILLEPAKKTPAVLQIPAVTYPGQDTLPAKRLSTAIVEKKQAKVPAVTKKTAKAAPAPKSGKKAAKKSIKTATSKSKTGVKSPKGKKAKKKK